MRKAELEMKTVVVIIAAIVFLLLIVGYLLVVEGGPMSLINNLLGFLNTTTDYVQATSNI
jgi:hypothetical protein